MTPISSLIAFGSHAEALHDLLISPKPATWQAALQACRDAISSYTPCVSQRRRDDLALQMFIEGADDEWHLADSAERRQVRDLFHRYVDAGYIRIHRPVAQVTARAVIGFTDNPPPDMRPLEVAVRRASIATTVALIEEGAEEEPDILETAWQRCNHPESSPALAAAITEALMRRRLAAHAAHQVVHQVAHQMADQKTLPAPTTSPTSSARRARVL